MSWFADLAGKAENLLNNLDEQTGAAIRNHSVTKPKKHDNSQHSEPPWTQKRRSTSRPVKKMSASTDTKSNNIVPTRNSSPSPSSLTNYRQSRAVVKENHDTPKNTPRKKSPTRKSNTQFHLNNSPKTLVGDIRDSENDDHFGLKHRRFSFPTDLELLNAHELTYKMQNFEVENAMLKNELNVMNREVSELLDRLQRNEDELNKTQVKFKCSENQNEAYCAEMELQKKQMEELKRIIKDITNVEIVKYKEKHDTLETDIHILKERNEQLEEKVKEMTNAIADHNTLRLKMETDLRHAQSTTNDLQSNLEWSKAECVRLEKDWEAYKLRVKGMLFAKDNEIKAMQEGATTTEDMKKLMEQLDKLKEERSVLSEAVSVARGECANMQRSAARRETRERALREALREEREARTQADAKELALANTLKALQAEYDQTISSLRTALRDKDSELTHLRNTASSIRDTSALNVADYEVTHDTIDNNRIHYLTETVVQKQGKIDALLADNNMLRIQLDKLESKYKTELKAVRSNNNHVVQLQDGDRRTRHAPSLSMSGMSLKIGVVMKKYPIFRMFIVIYMICLHFWVLTVLFTSTPDGHLTRQVKSV